MFFRITFFVCVLLNYTSGQAPLNKEYKAETYFKANWFQAYQFCRDHGMQLATINSDTEQQAILEQLPKGQNYMDYELFWISGSDLAEDGNYKWFSTGKPMSYTAWSYGYPIELYQDPLNPVIVNKADCVQINSGTWGWTSTNCSTVSYFMCETV